MSPHPSQVANDLKRQAELIRTNGWQPEAMARSLERGAQTITRLQQNAQATARALQFFKQPDGSENG